MVALVSDYCKHGDINQFIEINHPNPISFSAYRKKWDNIDNQDKVIFSLIETTSKCNFTCPMCIQSDGYPATKNMSKDLFDKILSEIVINEIPSVAMNQVNEPLLDKKIFDRIEAVSKVETVCDIHMNTNASLLNEERSIKIINSNLTRLLIGFDGFSKKTYEKVRRKGNYEQVLKNILNFLELKKKSKKVFPVVRISFVKTSENENEIKDWFDFWKDKVDYLTIQEFITPFTDSRRAYLIPKSSKRKNIDASKIKSMRFTGSVFF